MVVPNVALREHDIEQFEDDPLDFIRVDLAVSATGTDLATRRQAAADILQSLVGSGYEAVTTEIVGLLINTGLSDYTLDKGKNWKAKDSAIYLLTALATKGSTLQVGFSFDFWIHFDVPFISMVSQRPMLWLMSSSSSLTTCLKISKQPLELCTLFYRSMRFAFF